MIETSTGSEAHERAGRVRRAMAWLLCIVSFAVTSALGVWQVARGQQKERARAEAQAAMQAPAVPVDLRSMPDGAKDWPAHVAVTGRFAVEKTIFLDNRTRQGVPGFHVITPLCTTNGLGDSRHAIRDDGRGGIRCVAVLRGWIALNPAQRDVPPVVTTPAGPVTVSGRSLQSLDQPMLLGRDIEPGPHDRIWQHVDIGRIGRWSALPMAAVIVRQIDDGAVPDHLHRDWNEPGAGADRHYAYAFQWFAMSALMLGGMLAVLWRRRRRRRAHERSPTLLNE